VDYDHQAYKHVHTVTGAREVLQTIFPENFLESVLDVGCGTGTWLRAALERGAQQVLGVDGAEIPNELMQVPPDMVSHADLSLTFDLNRRFELVLCLETAEHLEAAYAETLIDTLVRHGDLILFSAAAPGQRGTHHVNCQWPQYWQKLFNDRGLVCSDSVRWMIWENGAVEPWYRQNLMLVRRDEASAGKEPRIAPVLHPVMTEDVAEQLRIIESGRRPWRWYVRLPIWAAAAKLRRRAGKKT
jgi:SAM-dependent methyltransferase